MSTVEQLLELLNKVPGWRRIAETPDRLDELQQRIAALEQRLSGTGDQCPKCKQQTLELIDTRPDPTFGALGAKVDYYKCSNPDCGYKTDKRRDR